MSMKLSEAVTLGSTILRPRGGYAISFGRHSGCAVGMALCALGHNRPALIGYRLARLYKWLKSSYPAPCYCIKFGRKDHDGLSIIMHLFDHHVMRDGYGDGTWTLDRLVNWIKSVEPPETCSECHSEQPVNEIQVCQECPP